VCTLLLLRWCQVAHTAWAAHQKVNPPTHASSSLPGFDGGLMSLIVSSNPPRYSAIPAYAITLADTRALIAHLLFVTRTPGLLAPTPITFDTRYCTRTIHVAVFRTLAVFVVAPSWVVRTLS
jgi:hypothetical protein